MYLACMMDGFSRKCVGWALSPFLEAGVALEALQMAITARKPQAGLIHHSDQGVQYASNRYVAVLDGMRAEISMSRTGNPYDNAKMERFMATVKLEEVHLNEYEGYEEARGKHQTFHRGCVQRETLALKLELPATRGVRDGVCSRLHGLTGRLVSQQGFTPGCVALLLVGVHRVLVGVLVVGDASWE